MTRILIHAGFHKTGTSTVQRGLETARQRLQGHAQIILKPDIRHLADAAQTYAKAPTADHLLRFRSHATDLFALIGDDPLPVVLSSEDLAGVMPGRAGSRAYEVAPELLATLEQAALPGQALTFYLSTRAPEPWVRSLWWQHLRATRFSDDFDTYRAEALPQADLSVVVAAIRARLASPPVTHALEDLGAMPQGPLTPIWDWLELPAGLRSRHPAENARPDLGLEPVFLALNRSGLPSDVVHQTKNKLLRIARRALGPV